MPETDKVRLYASLKKVESLAKGGKIKRFTLNPMRYLNAMIIRDFRYGRTKIGTDVEAMTFYDRKMHVTLPSSMDIYLTGGKTDNSEIRLARFLIKKLENGNVFVDIGAHYGFFTLLAAQLVGDQGRVIAFEASPSTFKTLNQNCENDKNIEVINKAVNDTRDGQLFFEFPNKYSEYNTSDISPFRNLNWFRDNKPTETTVNSVTLDDFFLERKLSPQIIKIDVEGTEYRVIKGAIEYLSDHHAIVVMEYWPTRKNNTNHRKAEDMLHKIKYKAYMITHDAQLRSIENAAEYLDYHQLPSDNIVFMRTES